jgi:hypothetical protein
MKNMMSQNNLANQQDSGCKIFVGGLTWNTTKDMLFGEFSKYGEIVDSIVMKNPETGNSRGFGFVTYKDNSAAENAVNSGSHRIDGKIVDVKLCNPRLAAQQRNSKQKSDNCKVFVGGLPHGVTDEEIKQFFSRYGQVKEFKMMYDENKQRPRGFGFITFESEESANQVLQEHYIQFNGKQIEVKPQIHNLKQQINPHHQQQMLNQGHYGGNANWNQNWGGLQGQSGQTPMQSGMPGGNAGNWGSYAPGNMNGGAQQQWGYNGGSGHPGGQSMSGPPYSGGGGQGQGAQSNWNYNYYGQPPQQGYYQADSAGTGTFNF